MQQTREQPETPQAAQRHHDGTGATATDPITQELQDAEVSQRVIAGLIDTALAIVVGFIPIIGGLAATAYWLVRDGLEVDVARQRSIGKKLMGLKPVRLDGQEMDIATSARRNWPFAFGGVAQVLMFIPFVGWLLVIPVALVALVVGIVEVVMILTGGRRLGDRTARTRVVKG